MNNTKNNPTPKTPEQTVNEVSRIAQGARVKGDITSAADIRVDGSVDGTLYSEGKVVTGETASLTGRLLCTNADFRGKMDGDIHVRDLLSLKSPAEVSGHLYVSKIQVELGVRINGTIRMISEEEFDRTVASLTQAAAPAGELPEQN